MNTASLDSEIKKGSIQLGRGNIISSKDIANNPGDYPIYSSSAKGTGEFGRCGNYMFDEELITWSVDGGGRFFFRSKHKFSVTNVSGFMRIDDDAWNKQFVYYCLDLQHQRIAFDYQTKAHPSVIRHLYELPKLLRSEQTKIAEVISTVDRAIEQTEALIAKQQRIKAGLMQDLLTRGIDEQGNLRSEQTHKFKASPLGRIPLEWNITSVGSVAESVTSGSRGWAKYYREEGALFIRIGNLTREHINLRLDDLVFVQPPESPEGLRTAVQEEDLLISVTADLGIIGVIPKDFVEGYVNQHIALARLHADVSARFVGWFLTSWEGRAQFSRLNESGAKAGLNLPTVRSLLFPRPADIDEQHRIAVAIDACVRTTDQHACSLQKLLALKRSLMQDLLTGNRRVTALLEQSEKVTT